MKKIFAIAAAVLLVFSLYGHAIAADVALTSVGQSPDAMMIRVVLRNMGISHDYDSLMKPEMLADQKVLIAVVGGSSKGLGAAGIDEEEETERAVALINAAQEKGMKILAMHVGGPGRRGQLSDRFITAVVPLADALIVVEGGNEDGLFDELTEGREIPMYGADSVKGTDVPLNRVLSGWGVPVE
jgi:hypothetical protein